MIQESHIASLEIVTLNTSNSHHFNILLLNMVIFTQFYRRKENKEQTKRNIVFRFCTSILLKSYKVVCSNRNFPKILFWKPICS